MATELIWKALEICSIVYNPILYPHIVTPKYTIRQISVETRYLKRKRLHLSTFVLTVVLLMELQFLASFLHILITFINQSMGHQLWGCLNEAIKFDRKLLGQGRFFLEALAQEKHSKIIRKGKSFLL